MARSSKTIRMLATAIKFNRRVFGVVKGPDGIFVRGHSRSGRFQDEEAARQFLGDNGLPARLARRLLDAELRGAGPFADPKHPRRVK
jgi:hypothetical protein